MDICVITNSALLARFIVLELAEAGYEAIASETALETKLKICDLDAPCAIQNADIGFSYDETKRDMVSTFLNRPIDTEKLKAAVEKYLKKPTSEKASGIEIDTKTRKAKTEKGEVRLSEKELALLMLLLNVPVLSREEGATVFGTGDSNVVDVYMHYLRKKLSKICGGETVCSKRGKGYFLADTIKVKLL